MTVEELIEKLQAFRPGSRVKVRRSTYNEFDDSGYAARDCAALIVDENRLDHEILSDHEEDY